MIKCPNCGGELKYNVQEKVVKCEHCGTKFNPKEKIATTKAASEGTNLEGKVYSCSQCGANLMTFDETAITFCSYCGSQAMIESKMITQNNPDFIIPFEINKEQCIETFKKKINKSIFVPNYMKSDLVVDKFRGIYIPYGVYKLGYNGPKKEKGSKYSHRSGDYEYYNDYSISFDVDAKYEGFSYDLSSKFYDRYSQAIPFDETKKLPFTPNYILGFYADAKDVEGNTYLDNAMDDAAADYKKRILSVKEMARYGCSKPSAIKFDQIEQKTGMFPLYFLAIRNKNQKNINYAIVNGQTGKLVTELPVSYPKYIIGSLILSAIIFLLINSSLILNPQEVCSAAIGFAIIGLIINFIQAINLSNRETHSDDEGLQSVKKDSKIKANATSIVSILISFISALLPVLVLAKNPAEDLYFYGAAIGSLGLVLLNFYNIIKKHNELVSTKLPQLEKRGGDESA